MYLIFAKAIKLCAGSLVKEINENAVNLMIEKLLDDPKKWLLT